MERKCKFVVCLIAAIVLVAALPLSVFAQDDAQKGATSTNPVTTFAELKTAIANATGTADAPTKIYISGMIEQSEKLVINNNQYVHLIGVGTGESGLKRVAVFSSGGDMIDVGNNNNTYVCGLILDNVVLDGGAVWSNGAGSTNSGISAGNSSILAVRTKAKATLQGGSILRNNAKSGGGGGVYLRGELEIIDGKILNTAALGSRNLGGGIQMKESTTKLILRENAVISGCYADGDGGSIYQELGGTFEIYGATLNNNTVASGKSGGAIFVASSNSKFLVKSGEKTGKKAEMTGNKAGNNGAAIYVGSGATNCTIELFDCTISGNHAGGAGAVYVPGAVGTVRLGGSVYIADNTAGTSNASSNLFVNTDGALSCIQIAKTLTTDASVGISFSGNAAEERQIAQKSADFVGSFDQSANAFFLDTPVENMGVEINGDLVMIADVTAKGCECEGGFTAGMGTVKSPYKITSANQLRHVEQHPDASYILAESINLTSVASWTPLCASTPFSGSFNGNGKTISGMTVSSGTVGGLFASVAREAVIYNMTLSGSITVGSTMTHAGGLAAVSYGTVKQVTSKVNITVSADAENAEIGGVVGFNGGTVAFSAYNGTIKGSGKNCNIGAIIGHSEVTNTALMPDMVTGHAGFGAASDNSSLKQDNTIDNIIHSINYGPDAIEVDVLTYDANKDGMISTDEFRLAHDESSAANGVKLSEVLSLLLGTHARASELNPAYARTVRIQLDMKKDGLIDDVLSLLDSLGFPYSRVILAGNNTYSHVQANVVAIRAAVAQGMDFWMNPDYILSYDAMANDIDQFIARIKALDISPFTVNSSFSSMTEEIQRKLSDAGIRVSVWTLNSVNDINAHMLRDVYNITSRMQESLVIREQLRTYGTLENTVSGNRCLPLVGLCSTTGTEECFEAQHSFAYVCSATCSVCDAVNPNAKTCVGNVPCIDVTCKWCGKGVTPVACKDDNKDHKCDNNCGNNTMHMDQHTDNADDDDHVCDYGCNAVLEACSGGSATCQTKATCSVCGEQYGEFAAHDMVTDAAVAATCTETGLTAGAHCSRCDSATTAQEIIPKIAHTYDNDSDATCNVCGAERTVENVANGNENNAQTGNNEAPAKQGLSGGAVAGIVIGVVAVLGGGFALFWFVIKKKKA